MCLVCLSGMSKSGFQVMLSEINLYIKKNPASGDGPHKPLAFDQILVHLFLLFVFNLTNKILFKPILHHDLS